jgi:GntR family transcriptional regulator/MocR family aminotransferase
VKNFPFPLALDSSSDAPVFVRISRSIAREIARGRLKEGDALPGTRTLARTLGVHRSTAVAAYEELAAQGWTSARRGGATIVAAASPESVSTLGRRAARAYDRGIAFDVDPSTVPARTIPTLDRGEIQLWGGVPDVRLVPVDLLARAYRRVAKRHGQALLGYAPDGRGHARLRSAIAEMIAAARGIVTDENGVLITRGSQMALDLAARALVRPKDVVALEAPGYPNAANVFLRAGAEVVPIRVDEHGLDVAAVEALARARPVRLVYVTPHHQYPTTVVLSPTRRLALLELARRERIAILEDDYDQEFHYDGRPVLPLAHADRFGSVIYVGTLAKILAPALRLGFVVAPAPVLARMADERVLIDRQGDAVLECAVAELLEDGDVQRHVRKARRVYHERRDALCYALDQRLSGALTYAKPQGGLAIWARTAGGIDVDRWHARAAERGLHFQIGKHFSFAGARSPFLRLGYASLDEHSLSIAMRRLTESLPTRR